MCVCNPGQKCRRLFNQVIKLGAQPYHGHIGPMELNIPAIRGIGRSLIYLVDRYGEEHSIYDVDFIPLEGVEFTTSAALG